MTTYEDFLLSKRQLANSGGFAPINIPDHLFDFQKLLVTWAIQQGRAAIFADCGMGKLQPVDEPVLTPTGWLPIGDITPGDLVIGSNGLPTRVSAIFPQGQLETVTVRFSDGSSTRCGWEHLWAVKSQNDRTRGRANRVMTTREIFDAGLTYGRDRTSRQWSIPLVDPIQFADVNTLPIDPYLLGVILGDGHIGRNGSVRVTTDRAILAALPADGAIRPHKSTAWVAEMNVRGMSEPIRALGLAGCRSHEKFIPAPYLTAPHKERLALLRGLMDTDGYALPDGGTEFSSTSERLTDDVVELARSLGGLARKGGSRVTTFADSDGRLKDGKPSWRVNVKMLDESPFQLDRKASQWVAPTKYPPVRLIDSIESAGVEESVCIKVEADDGLYVTRDYIVTHNTPMALAWADNVYRHTGKPVLLLTPLAVGFQIVAEAHKFGHDAAMSRDGTIPAPITVTNYEQLPKFDWEQFGGVVCDESSALKSFEGVTRAAVTEFMRRIQYRLLDTATAAPNDYIELGTSSEALGLMGHVDMLTRFFTNDNRSVSSRGRAWNGKALEWRLKGHAGEPFWRWVSSWARAIRKPSDYGYPDDGFHLPELIVRETRVEANRPANGTLFDIPANGFSEEREETRRTLVERCEAAAGALSDTDMAVAWCHLNAESELLTSLIDDAVEVTGSDSTDAKEEALAAFSRGEIRCLVIKPVIGAFGLNWQHCHRMTYFPSHSYELWYQAVRRCWRFGQQNPVTVDVITTEGGARVLANLQRKAAQADQMFTALVEHMNHARTIDAQRYNQPLEVPAWLAEH